MTYVEQLADYLYNNPDRITKHFHISPGPNYEPEAAAKSILEALISIENGGGRDIDLNI